MINKNNGKGEIEEGGFKDKASSLKYFEYNIEIKEGEYTRLLKLEQHYSSHIHKYKDKPYRLIWELMRYLHKNGATFELCYLQKEYLVKGIRFYTKSNVKKNVPFFR